MNIDLDQIKIKYPKAMGKFLLFLQKEKKIKGDICFIMAVLYKVIANGICFCDLEKFFDINIGINKLNFEFGSLQRKFMNPADEDAINIKETLREQVIYKAFEILEGKLNDN
jgi:hypothetical protein